MQLAVNQEGTWLSPRASVKEQNTPVTEFKNWEKLSTLLEEGWPLTHRAATPLAGAICSLQLSLLHWKVELCYLSRQETPGDFSDLCPPDYPPS